MGLPIACYQSLYEAVGQPWVRSKLIPCQLCAVSVKSKSPHTTYELLIPLDTHNTTKHNTTQPTDTQSQQCYLALPPSTALALKLAHNPLCFSGQPIFRNNRTGKIISGQWPEHSTSLGETRQAMHNIVTPSLQQQTWVPVLLDSGDVESNPRPKR